MNQAEPLHVTLNRAQRALLAVGVVAAVAAAAGGWIGGLNQFFQSYLVAFLFWIGISLGSLGLLMLHFVAGGRWGVTIRRITEAASGTIWIMALLFIPLIFGLPYLYVWTDPAVVAGSEVLQHKALYLNPTFFVIRAVIYFAIWIGLAFYLSRNLARQEEHPANPGVWRRLRRISTVGLILYVITMTFAATDWIMSLQPLWSSSMFGMLIVISQGLSALAFAVVVLPLLLSQLTVEPAHDLVSPAIYRDLGAVLLSFVVGWAYLSYFQFLIIWAANLPRETFWYIDRIRDGWLWVAILIVLVQFALPFFALIPMRIRSNLRFLAGIGLLILAVNYLYYFWQVMPAFYPAIHIHWLDLVLPLAIGGLWMFAFIGRLKARPIQPVLAVDVEDRRLAEERK